LYFTDHHSDDYKWTVDENKQGHYILKLDALEETIQSVYYPETTTNLDNNKENLQVFGTHGKIVVNCDTEQAKTIEVFVIDGRKVANMSFNHTAEIELPTGIYIVKVKDGNSTIITRKVSVLK